MKQILLLLFSGISNWLLAQNNSQLLPLQGRLSNASGLPLTGNYSFNFQILGTSYNETQANVPVNNGLYAVVLGANTCCPLPNNLFFTNSSQALRIAVNGTAIDTVAIYPSLKRNIFWNEILNKPTVIDTSNLNEIQTISLNNNQLSLSNGGGTVTLPSSGQSGNHFPNGIYVGDTLSTPATPIAIPNTNATQQLVSSAWQSFSLPNLAQLAAIKVYFANTNNNDFLLKIYPGIGTGNQAMFTQYFVCNTLQGAYSLQNLNINSTLNLQANTDYTFELQVLNSTTCISSGTTCLIGVNTNNPYNTGVTSFGSSTDLIFQILVNQITNYSLEVNDTTASFGVNVQTEGRYRDKTGFVCPVGNVTAYAGNVAPQGWLLCDGSNFPINQYPDLYAAIGNNFGGMPGLNFNVPDTRGLFLRGVDGAAGNDPDASTRTAPNTGANTGNNVGSKQVDDFKSHNHLNAHLNPAVKVAAGTNHFNSFDPNMYSYNGTTQNTGGAETRPKNLYVHYIIKY